MTPRTLILRENMSGQLRAHSVKPWNEAVTMLFNGKIRVLETYDEIVGHLRFDQLEDFEHFLDDLPESAFDGDLIVLRTPSVVVLKDRISDMKKGVKFSRSNVLARDKYKCAYCNGKFSHEELNYDHVVPRSQGGLTCWENIVSACYPCNAKKGGRTPEQAKMKLWFKPYRPKSLPLTGPLVGGVVHETWVPWV